MENVIHSLFSSHSAGSFREKRLCFDSAEMPKAEVEAKAKEIKEKMPQEPEDKINDMIKPLLGRGKHAEDAVDELRKHRDKVVGEKKQLKEIKDRTAKGTKEWDDMVADIKGSDVTKKNAALEKARKLIDQALDDMDAMLRKPGDRAHNFMEQLEAHLKNMEKTKKLDPAAFDLPDTVTMPSRPPKTVTNLIKKAGDDALQKIETDHETYMSGKFNDLLTDLEKAKNTTAKNRAIKNLEKEGEAQKTKLMGTLKSVVGKFPDADYNADKQIAAIFEQMKDISNEVKKAKGEKVDEPKKDEDKKPDAGKGTEKPEEKKVEKIPDDVQKKVDAVKEAYKESAKDLKNEANAKKVGEKLDALNGDDGFKKLSVDQKKAIEKQFNDVVDKTQEFKFDEKDGKITLGPRTSVKAPDAKEVEKKENEFIKFLRELIALLRDLGYISDRKPGDKMPAGINVQELEDKRVMLSGRKMQLEKDLADAKTSGKDAKEITRLENELKKVNEEIALVNAELKKGEDLKDGILPGGRRLKDVEDKLRRDMQREFGIDPFDHLEIYEDGKGVGIRAYMSRERIAGMDPRRMQDLARRECWDKHRVPCSFGYMDGMPTVNVQVVQIANANAAGAAGDAESKTLD